MSKKVLIDHKKGLYPPSRLHEHKGFIGCEKLYLNLRLFG